MKPILFNTEMVRAILDGRKTTTRRPLKPQPSFINPDMSSANYIKVMKQAEIKPPYQKGDILYVRETWTHHEGAVGGIIFKARCPANLSANKKWHPSIHMPKSAARIFLRVTDVRAERLWDISEEDVIAEGFNVGDKTSDSSSPALTAKQSFVWTWQKIYDKGDHPWALNPWVWVIEFERVPKGSDKE